MEQDKSGLLMSRLKQETETLHKRIQALPFFTSLTSGTLPLAAYVNQLRVFATAFGALEHETASITEPAIRAVLDAGESRFTHLLRDLGCFGHKMVPEIISVKRHADAMASRIRLLSIEDPVSLLGYIYVLQGTVLGNRVHLPDIKRTFNIDSTNGAAFYEGYGNRLSEYWNTFVNLMNSFTTEKEITGRILAAAHEAFGFLQDIHASLFPLPTPDGMTFTATSLNPEAGSHEVPADEREIAAAITAGKLCREEFPYFDERYGERGKRFTDSDAAWLATLTALTPPLIISQVAWLGAVLASRGMPRITMERQLVYLHKELGKTVPEKQNEYDKLLGAVSWLEKERLRHIGAEMFDSLCQAFISNSGNELGGRMKKTGSLIVSAVCDEKAGIEMAVQGLEAWLTDAERFNAAWCSAVSETIAQARTVAV